MIFIRFNPKWFQRGLCHSLFAALILTVFMACGGKGSSDGDGTTPPVTTTIAVTGVSVKTGTSLNVGGTETLVATIAPANATNQNLIWTSGDSTVATVSTSGLVTAIKVGTATITVTTVDGNFTETCNVTVTTNPPVTKAALHTSGNHIYTTADDQIWQGRGANIPDTRLNGRGINHPPSVAETKRRIDELVDNWHADFMRLCLESRANGSQSSNYQSVLDDAGYLADIQEIVQYVGTKPGVHVLVAVWVDPSFSTLGWPSTTTCEEWKLLAKALGDQPQVMFGLCNEPQSNSNGAQDAQVWDAMSAAVKAIRDVEEANGYPQHIITVQGTRDWARSLEYYITHPITERNGDNIAYEVHVYNETKDFESMVTTPAGTLPVIIGEFGPVTDVATMLEVDIYNLMDLADQLQIPYLGWSFHERCPPSMLEETGVGGDAWGIGISFVPTAWGQLMKDRLSGTLSVTVSPKAVSLLNNTTTTLKAFVSGSSNKSVTWKVQEANGGTVNSTGLYTAPASAGTYHVIATSSLDTTRSATTTVTVLDHATPWDPQMVMLVDGGAWWCSMTLTEAPGETVTVQVLFDGAWRDMTREEWPSAYGNICFAGTGTFNVTDGATIQLKAISSDASKLPVTTVPFVYHYGTLFTPTLQ